MADAPFLFGAQHPQQSPTSPSLAQALGGCGCQNQLMGPAVAHSTPAARMGGSSHRGKEAEVPPHATPLPCCRAPEHSMHQAESVEPWELFTGCYVPNPHAAVLRNMASTLEKFIHSLDLRALPRVLQIQSGIYGQGEHSVFSGRALQACIWHQVPPSDWNVECGGGTGRMLMELSPSNFLPAEEWVFYQWLWKCVHLVFSLAVKKKL